MIKQIIQKYQNPSGKILTPHVDYLGVPYRSDGDYDYFGAHPSSVPSSKNEHWPSRNESTGQLLKSESHPTYDLMINGETLAGYETYKGFDGRLYSKQWDTDVPYPYRPNTDVDFSNITATNKRGYDKEAIEYINNKLQHLPNDLRAVIIGNIIEESGGNPFIKSETGKYQGLLQWGPDRYQIPATNVDKFTLIDQQLDYLLSTLNNPYDQKSWHHGGTGSGYQTAKDAYNTFFNSDLWNMHHAFSRGYVRPEGKDGSVNNRFKVVQQIIAKYH